MTTFHAVMLDETACEFGVTVKARSKFNARQILAEDYPESRCVQLESHAETMHRERREYARARFAYDHDGPMDREDY